MVALRPRHMRFRIALATALVLTLAACAGDGPQSGSQADPEAGAPAPPAAEGGPLALIGLWTVEDTDEKPGTVLRIAPKKQLSLWRDCGTLNGAWAGADNLFLATLHGGSGGCFANGEPPAQLTPGWLLRANGYKPDGAALALVDQAGAVVARLVAGGKPKVTDGVSPEEAEPPVVTDEDRAALSADTTLPAGLAAVDRNALVGRWVPVSGGATAFVAFQADGVWTGSDGCNGNGGRWAAGPQGTFLATGGPSTLMACDGAAVPTWLSTAAQAGLADGQLVLVDAAGTEVGRLRKS
ncbi:hypothetical protein Voc01_042410 [Virgisporangium ochraceum]|uniref:DUF306 domain-containing protein n=2 Tax=Virgisporangium ochraceum TaxID=65505 RepID=A0A8J4EC67_9ACTN|nr:hypothetical protein Voc01_042410 [Virgisporangium ochraceum]